MNTKNQVQDFNQTMKQYKKITSSSTCAAFQRSNSIVLKKLKIVNIRNKSIEKNNSDLYLNEVRDPQFSKFEQIESKWKFSNIINIK